MARKKNGVRVKTPPFAMMPKAMIQSPGYRALSCTARMVLVELLAQYSGSNNGDLSATRTMAKDWGIASAHTLQKALKDLEEAGWILISRNSVFSKHGARCALFALAWLPVDECPGKDLDIGSTRSPPRPLPTLFVSKSSCAESA